MFRWSSRSGSVIGSGSGRSGARLLQGAVRSVLVVERLELAERVQKVALVPDQGAVEELAPAGLYPALHDGVHAGYPDAGGDDLDARVLEDGVERGRELAVAVPDQVAGLGARVFEVHDEVARGLGDPVRGGVGGRAEDADAAGGVLDDGEDVQRAR